MLNFNVTLSSKHPFNVLNAQNDFFKDRYTHSAMETQKEIIKVYHWCYISEELFTEPAQPSLVFAEKVLVSLNVYAQRKIPLFKLEGRDVYRH